MSNYSSSFFADDPNTPWYKAFQLIDKNTTVLDIGCSSGNFGEVLIQEKKCTVDGVEISKEDIVLAKKKLRDVFSFNIENEAPKELIGKYDYVYYGDVIEHLVNPVTALRNTEKLLKKNGKIVFSIPNMTHISVRLMLLGGHFDYGKTGLLDNTHLHFYSKQEVERVFNDAGYDIVELDWVKRDIPKAILDKKLAKSGLTANDDFHKLAKSVDWAAYQYVGVAKRAVTGKIVKRNTVSPLINEFENQVDELNKVHKQEISRIERHYKNLLAQQKEKYENELNEKISVPQFVNNINHRIRKHK